MGITSTEWAALIAVGGTVAGAAVGGYITLRVAQNQAIAAAGEGNRQRAHDAEQRRLDRDHEIRLRDQERKQTVYVDLFRLIIQMTSYARGVRDHVDEKPDSLLPPAEISKESLFAAGAVISTALSKEISEMARLQKRLIEEWRLYEGTPNLELRQRVMDTADEIDRVSTRAIVTLRDELGALEERTG